MIKIKGSVSLIVLISLIALLFVVIILQRQEVFQSVGFRVYDQILGIGEDLGIIQQESLIAGTGSMYPTFPRGKSKEKLEQLIEVVGRAKVRKFPGGVVIFGKKYFDYKLQRNDIVFFNNPKTAEILKKDIEELTSSKVGLRASINMNVGFVKRLIALSGDTIEIRDGFVKLNNQVLSEGYIASARSTYGGNFLPECQLLKVPKGYVFVMGDNRKESNDSRFDVGLVSMSDIKNVIPFDKQDALNMNWRDTSTDEEGANSPTLDVPSYLNMLNHKRTKSGLKPFKYQKKLEQSAQKRAEVILKFNDLSYEGTRSGYTMVNALSEVGYSNIVWGEAPTLGYYTSEELIENSFAFPQRKKFLLNHDFEEIGIVALIGVINGCPVQIVVQHMAGYVPPNYKVEDIDNLKATIKRLEDILPGWNNLKNYPEYYQENKLEVDRIVDIIQIRINNFTKILSRMEANQWLKPDEKELLEKDKSLDEEQNNLAKKLL